MKFVQPIRDQRKIDAIKHFLKNRNERDYVLFMVGINTGLRISDILNLTVKDVLGTHIDITEGKTGKRRYIKIRKGLRKALDDFIAGKADFEFLFVGRSAKHTGEKDEKLDVSTVYKVLRQAGRVNGVENIGTHSMRKTFGYHYYLRTKDIAFLMQEFNHSSPAITLRYIGVFDDVLDDIEL